MTAADTTALLEKLDKPDAWRVRDYADGWIISDKSTERYSAMTGAYSEPLFALTPSDLEAIKAALVEREELRKTLRAIDTWAEQRCPCRDEKPNPCPLCGADANKSGDICLSAENTFPPHLLREIRRTLPPRAALGKDKS